MMKTLLCTALFAASLFSVGGALSAEAASHPTIALTGPVEEPSLFPKDKKNDKKDDEDKEEDVKVALELVEPSTLDGMLRVRAASIR